MRAYVSTKNFIPDSSNITLVDPPRVLHTRWEYYSARIKHDLFQQHCLIIVVYSNNTALRTTKIASLPSRSSVLVSRKRLVLILEYHCVEPPPPSQPNDVAQPANGPQDKHPLSLPSLHSLVRSQDSLEDDDGDDCLPTFPSCAPLHCVLKFRVTLHVKKPIPLGKIAPITISLKLRV